MFGIALDQLYPTLINLEYDLQFDSLSFEFNSSNFLVKYSYKVYSDGTDVGLGIGVILLIVATANRKSKQDFPTPESPMSKSLNK